MAELPPTISQRSATPAASSVTGSAATTASRCSPRMRGEPHTFAPRLRCLRGICVGEWYHLAVSGTYSVTMGDRGRLVVPAEIRERLALRSGTPLVLVASERGVFVMTRDQARALVREQLAGADLVDELLAERRRQARAEDAE